MFEDTKDAQTNHCPLCEENGREIAKLQALIAMQAEALKDIANNFDCDSDAHKYGTTCRSCLAKQAISATAESVAAWEEAKLKPLQDEIERLREESNRLHLVAVNARGDLLRETKKYDEDSHSLQQQVAILVAALVYHQKLTLPIQQSIDALYATQATAEAYDKEVKAKVLDDLAFKMRDAGELSAFMEVIDFIHILESEAAELRAKNGG